MCKESFFISNPRFVYVISGFFYDPLKRELCVCVYTYVVDDGISIDAAFYFFISWVLYIGWISAVVSYLIVTVWRDATTKLVKKWLLGCFFCVSLLLLLFVWWSKKMYLFLFGMVFYSSHSSLTFFYMIKNTVGLLCEVWCSQVVDYYHIDDVLYIKMFLSFFYWSLNCL